MKKLSNCGGVLVFLGALFWSLNSPLVKYLSIDPLLIILLRSVIAGLVLLPLLRPKHLVWNPWILVYMAAYAGLTLSVILSLSMTAAPIATGMQYSSIIWFFLMDLWIYRKIRIKQLIPAFIVFSGVVLFMGSSGGQGSDPLGNLIALTEGISFAFLTISSKKSAGSNPVGLVALANWFTALLILPFITGLRDQLPLISPKEWVILAILGSVQVGLGYTFYNMGALKIPAQKASIIALWEVILGTLWVMIFLHEYPNQMVLIGFAVILAGMVLDALWTEPQKAAEERKAVISDPCTRHEIK